MTFKVTAKHKKIVTEMARNGLNINMIAASVGCCEKTFKTNKELMSVFKVEYVKSLERVATTLIQRALANGEDSGKLLMFLANTRLRFGENQFTAEINLEGTYKEQKKELKRLLKNKEINVTQYKDLSASLVEEYKVEEMEEIKKRLDELENSKSTYNKN